MMSVVCGGEVWGWLDGMEGSIQMGAGYIERERLRLLFREWSCGFFRAGGGRTDLLLRAPRLYARLYGDDRAATPQRVCKPLEWRIATAEPVELEKLCI